MNSILTQAGDINYLEAKTYDLLTTTQELDLIKYLADFPNVVDDAASSREPYLITNYTQKVAQLFHSFYNECRVNDPSNLELSKQRLGLVVATKIVLANALNLIGVEAPEKM